MKRNVPLKRSKFSALRRSSLKSVNPANKAKRRKRYEAYMRSPEWKAIRLEVFERDGFRCTAIDSVPLQGVGEGRALSMGFRCEVEDESRSGAGLHCHHRGYAHFGSEQPKHLMTLCAEHHRRRHALEGKRIHRP